MRQVPPSPLIESSLNRNAATQATRYNRLAVKNAVMGTSIALFVAGVYWYSMYAVRQDDISDEFLESIGQKVDRREQERKLS